MKNKKFLTMPLLLIGLFVLLVNNVFGTITYSGVTEAQTIRADTVLTYSSSLGTVTNTTLTLYNSANTVQAIQRTSTNASTYTIVFNDLVADTYHLQVLGTNATGETEDTGAVLTFKITGCTNTNYALWGIVMLVFVIGLLYFAYTGFIEGHSGSLIAFLIMLTIAVVVVGSFSLAVLRPLC